MLAEIKYPSFATCFKYGPQARVIEYHNTRVTEYLHLTSPANDPLIIKRIWRNRFDSDRLKFNTRKFSTSVNLKHRLDGPAVEYDEEFFSTPNEWYYEGIFIPVISKSEFESYLKLKMFW